MTTYYLSPSGSDANNGLGPDASDSTNKPWLTIGKALGASGISSGDTVYVAPGTYRETVTVAMTSATAETQVIGDVANAQGFKNGSGVLLNSGAVRWTAYTTNDTTAPSASDVLDLTSKDYLTFVDIWFVGSNAGTGAPIDINTSENLTFRRCLFTPGHVVRDLIDIAAAVDIASNILFDSCVLLSLGANAGVVRVELPTSSSADYDSEITFRNCLIANLGAGSAVYVSVSFANAFKGGGVKIHNSTVISPTNAMYTSSPNIATSAGNKCEFYNNISLAYFGLSANTSGQIVEDYNLIYGGTTHTNVTAGANSVYASTAMTHALMLHFGQSMLWGMQPRPPFEPTTGSPQLGRGSDASVSLTTDMYGRPRPSGGASASKSWGALERGNTFAKGTGTVRTGSNALEITGPGVQDFQLPVDATSTTVSAYVRWDATYAGTKPAMSVLNCEEAGVTAATDTATGSSGAWEELSLNFTPARAGIVTVRFQSSDTNGGGKMFVDDFNVT